MVIDKHQQHRQRHGHAPLITVFSAAEVNEIQQNGHHHPGQQQKASSVASRFQGGEIISAIPGRYNNSQRDDDLPDRMTIACHDAYPEKAEDDRDTIKRVTHQPSPQACGPAK